MNSRMSSYVRFDRCGSRSRAALSTSSHKRSIGLRSGECWGHEGKEKSHSCRILAVLIVLLESAISISTGHRCDQQRYLHMLYFSDVFKLDFKWLKPCHQVEELHSWKRGACFRAVSANLTLCQLLDATGNVSDHMICGQCFTAQSL